jgi:hypothetical protein
MREFDVCVCGGGGGLAAPVGLLRAGHPLVAAHTRRVGGRLPSPHAA